MKSAKRKKTKYNNIKVEFEGQKFDSMLERDYYLYLLNNKKELNIKEIELQPVFLLLEGFKKFGKNFRSISYKGDFKITYNDLTEEIVDTKSKATLKSPTFIMKHKMLLSKYDIDFYIVERISGSFIKHR
jgi:hypothetical protein